MNENCKHDIKVGGYDIFSTKAISKVEFKCVKCKRKIRLKGSEIVTYGIFPLISFFAVLFVFNPFINKLYSENVFAKYGYTALIIVGTTSVLIWITNFIIWLLRKKLKYVEVEDETI